MSWKITIAGGNLSFSAAHFISLDGGFEPLHGHNYGLSAEVTGDTLTAESYLLDFGVIKALLRGLIGEVNHRFLLPLRNPHMRVLATEREWELRLENGERYVMPRSSVVALAVDNATAERLAEYFAHRLLDALRERGVTNIQTITVGVAETETQTAYHELRALDPG